MRLGTISTLVLISGAVGLSGCSTAGNNTASNTVDTTPWWQSLSFLPKRDSSSTVAANNAPAAPSFGSTAPASAPSVAMPGGYAATGATYSGGTQYPVTPYPPTHVPTTTPPYAAGTNVAAGYGSMPVTDPYAQTAPSANPYATAMANSNPYQAPSTAPTNRYTAPASGGQAPASPYAAANRYGTNTTQQPAYTANYPHGATQ